MYAVTFPDGDCLCGTRLTVVAKKRMQTRAALLLPASAPVQRAARTETPSIPRLEMEFLRVVRTELATLAPEEREAMREDYAQQIAEAQKHLESLMRVAALIDSYSESTQGQSNGQG